MASFVATNTWRSILWSLLLLNAQIITLVSSQTETDVPEHHHTSSYDSAIITSPLQSSTTTGIVTVVTSDSRESEGSEESSGALERSPAVERALIWLKKERQSDWGWGNETHRAILALQLANGTLAEMDKQPLDMQLSIKQMEIEILLMLSKHHESPPPLSRLAAYALALSSLCRPPRAFHSRDLVTVLLHREPQHPADFAYATLAACASGAAHVRKRHIRRLLDIANAAAEHNVDTIAMVILALRCIVQDHRHRNLLHFVRRPMAGLARLQQPDGGFGAVLTTALAIQALDEKDSVSGFGEAHQSHWNRSAATAWLEARQERDGGWSAQDVLQTAEAIIALGPRGLSDVRTLDCGDRVIDQRHDTQETYGGDGSVTPPRVSHPADESDARNVSFTYTLWLGTNVTENYTLYMMAPRNVSFFHVMQLAAEQDPKFEFSASEWPNGHYVHTLAGFKEEPMGYHYWLLYRLPEIPDPASPPGNQLVAPVGVDDLLVEEGEHYLFWYKKL